MKNATTPLKTDLKQTTFLGNVKSECVQIPRHRGSRISWFVCTIVCTILVLSLYLSCLLDGLSPTPAWGIAHLRCFSVRFPYHKRNTQEASKRGTPVTGASLGHSAPVPASHSSSPIKDQEHLPLPLNRFLFAHKMLVTHAWALNPEFTYCPAFSTCSLTWVYLPPAKGETPWCRKMGRMTQGNVLCVLFSQGRLTDFLSGVLFSMVRLDCTFKIIYFFIQN